MSSVTYGGTNHGIQVGTNNGSVTAEFHQCSTPEDINRFCLRNLRCPDSLVVKHRLTETKDKLHRQSFEWILQDPQYQSWRNGQEICLLWIKGGAGKGKTMMSIGLIDELSRIQHDSTMVTYFFCQNADSELNTLESILKGLILRLVNQQIKLTESLRRRWDTKNDRFHDDEDVTSWRHLWNIFLEMLDRCTASRIYIIVDALDECQDGGMVDFLKLIVRNGLGNPAKLKWLLTSRPLDSAERALLAGNDQVQVSLELNSDYVSEAVKAYIAYKVDELSLYRKYGQALKSEVKTALSAKAEGTFLWVSLVCNRLESVHRDKALTTIRNLPPGLHSFYDRILNQLSEGEPDDVFKCMRLLKAMMLAYQPLKVEEVSSVTGIADEDDAIEMTVNRCASFLRMQENKIEFVHQSARDYLGGENAQPLLDPHKRFGHYEIALGCLSHLAKRLKVNLLDLPRPDSTIEDWKPLNDGKKKVQLSCLDYAATFWVHHLEDIERRSIVQSALIEKGLVGILLHSKLLEWLECLILLGKLPMAIEAFKALVNITKGDHLASALVQDANRFLLQHYQLINCWPLQIYSTAIIFSPESSVVKKNNLDRIPAYLKNVPIMQGTWGSLIRTLEGHSNSVWTLAFSPDGKQIASGSGDDTIKLWDTASGDLQKTLEGHKYWVNTVAFSSDSKQIVSGSDEKTIRLWDAATGNLQMTLEGHLESVNTVAFSPDGKQIASGSSDDTIKLWDTVTGNLQMTLEGHLESVNTVAFSPDGKQIVSGSDDKTIKLWDTAIGDLQKTIEGHSNRVNIVAFSLDGKQIASGSDDNTIKLWDTATDNLQKTLEGHLESVNTMAFSPDGKQIASGSNDNTIKLWDTATGDLQKTIEGHSDWVRTVAFSLDGKQIASGSDDNTIKLWDTAIDDLQEDHSDCVRTVAFSLDGKQIASSSDDNTIKLWDTTTGDLQKILEGHSYWVRTVAFSPDGKQIASGSDDNTIKLWNTITGDFQKILEGHSRRVNTIAFSPDGKQIASGSDDKTIVLWDTVTGDLQKILEGHSRRVNTVAFSPDGKQIASGSDDNTVKLWDIAKYFKSSYSLPGLFARQCKLRHYREFQTSEPVVSLNFSPCNRYLATNIGPIMLECIATDKQDRSRHSLQSLDFREQWIFYGETPFFRLPSGFLPSSLDVQGDQVAIGLRNGQVLSLNIDRHILQSMLDAPVNIE
ncbi:G-protein beta WD- 40 repeats containing protein [Penicillium pulvis]|uniref:G-protein beta WD- 40 repeats containing protein n=1 Tax=Penicillium pulvis TaxID=1562058 RepID=UPI00254967FF|nr:G-protein beta WD- 40 repeats containing protein [Penicillium pulvis]KAJ5805509.1 G-protein beta WD- 40 repeats containing protein [Penicillium pulvis]